MSWYGRTDRISWAAPPGRERRISAAVTFQRSNGDTIGEIDQVMIEPARGRIANLLLSSGGFLGIGNDWLPVPPEAVAWSPDKDAYVLNDKNMKPAAMQVLHKTDLPGAVQRSQLEALYKRFNIRPYWVGGTSQNQG